MALVIDFINEVAQRAGQQLDQVLKNEETLETHLMRGFNFYHKDFNSRRAWPWRMDTRVLQTVANYKTGTITSISGRTVTGSGTVWTSAMEGRFIKLDSERDWYEILTVNSATSLVLRDPYIGTNTSGTYIIWKKYYELDPDVPYAKFLQLSEWPHASTFIPKENFNPDGVSAFLNTGKPAGWTWGHISKRTSSYATGTVTATKDSRILTGAGTSWLDNVRPGSKITIGTNTYNVFTVDSDTQITMVQNATADVPASTAYTITAEKRSQIMLSSAPNPAVNLYLTFPRRVYDIKNGNDEVDVWEGFEHILVNVLYGYYLEKLTSEKAFQWLKIYEGQIREAWSSLQEGSPVQHAARTQQSNVSGYRRSLHG